MTISESLNLSDSKEDYHTEYFPVELMDETLWTYPVTDKGVDGIELLHKQYGLWSNTIKGNNVGRFLGTEQSHVRNLRDDIESNGVDCSQQPAFIDIDTGDILTGGHRHDACALLKIPGWMFQYVRCSDDWSRKTFAKTLNNDRPFNALVNDRDEVIEYIKYGIKHGKIKTQQDIEDAILLVANNSIPSKAKRSTIVKEMVSYITTNGISTVKLERYTSYNEKTYQDFISRSKDPYVDDVLNNPNERNYYINMDNWGSRTNPLITEAGKTPVDGWLNIQASVATPSPKESLDVKRGKVHEVYLDGLAKTLDRIFSYKVMNNCYPFQHKNCQHAFLSQDHHQEGVTQGEFIRK